MKLISKIKRSVDRYFSDPLFVKIRWGASLLYKEYRRDEVRVRAESLSYLMLFSILPLIAGCFFIFSIFAQFGMVQEAIQSGVDQLLSNIPSEHRAFVQDYVLKFKDVYLGSISKKSGSIGIFALLILGYVGIKLFINIEETLNIIWSSDRSRSLLDQIRNFLVVSVAGPIVIVAGLSVPLILNKIALTKSVFAHVPLALRFLHQLIPFVLSFGMFISFYKYIPTRFVKWRSAFYGALFSTILLQFANLFMQVYFSYGTQTAYGAAAIVPLVAFWIYIVWVIVILGAEVSYLAQNHREADFKKSFDPSLREGEALLKILVAFQRAFETGKTPVFMEELAEVAPISMARLREILVFLEKEKLVAKITSQASLKEGWVLTKSLEKTAADELLRDFFNIPTKKKKNIWDESIDMWISQFEGKPISDLFS